MRFYACPMCCNQSFASQQDLKDHLARANASMKCPACSKPFKNVLFLIKHLEQCDYEEEEEEVDGYFCTVCDIKIQEVEEHVRRFHCGQEVILQDDDEEEEEDVECISPSNVQYSCPNGSNESKSPSKRKHDELVNGTNPKDKRLKSMSSVQDDEEEEEGEGDSDEVFYCPKCDMNFHSLSEHTAVYHKNMDVLVKDITILDLFSKSRQSNGAFAYHCSCCQKNIVRKKTLVKHLKLISTKDNMKTTKSKHQNTCKKSKSLGSSSLDNSFNLKNETDEQVDAESVYELEEVKPDPDGYDLNEIGPSIFND